KQGPTAGAGVHRVASVGDVWGEPPAAAPAHPGLLERCLTADGAAGTGFVRVTAARALDFHHGTPPRRAVGYLLTLASARSTWSPTSSRPGDATRIRKSRTPLTFRLSGRGLSLRDTSPLNSSLPSPSIVTTACPSPPTRSSTPRTALNSLYLLPRSYTSSD